MTVACTGTNQQHAHQQTQLSSVKKPTMNPSFERSLKQNISLFLHYNFMVESKPLEKFVQNYIIYWNKEILIKIYKIGDLKSKHWNKDP